MKLLFFSDVHGVPAALETLFRRAEELHPDMLILLGDALYHGPRNGVPVDYDTKRTAELLNSRRENILAVRGNCDAEVDQLMLDFPIFAEYSEVLLENKRFFLTHGHFWNASHLPVLPQGAVLAHGHTHIPLLCTQAEGITVFNPGSISLPKGGNPASFGVWEDGKLSVRRLDDGRILLLEGKE